MTEAGLPELDVARVRRWCQQRVPEHARSQVKAECDVAARHLTIVECRPPWRDRHLRFHLYDRVTPSPRIDDLLREIDRGPAGIFRG